MMDAPKKIIAVCTTQLEAYDRSSFIEGLYSRLDKDQYKLIVFNSHRDFETHSPSDAGAKAVFDIINHDKIDCLIIDKRHFKSDDVFDEIVERSKERKTPVIVLNSEKEGCFCINTDYFAAYEELINHLVTVHNYHDFFFIGGVKGEPESEKRLAIFRKTLLKYNLEISDERIAYGLYYEDPVYEIFDELYRNNRLPQVFVCANDVMALAIYQKAQEYGLKIPEDFAVTGFDGLPYSQFITPPLATCQENYDDLMRRLEEIIGGVCCHTLPVQTFLIPYKALAKGSCGCKTESIRLSNNEVIHGYRDLDRCLFYETNTYNTIDKAIAFDCQSNIYEMLVNCSLPSSSVCIKGDYSSTLNDLLESDNRLPKKFFVLASESDAGEEESHLNMFPYTDMVPHFEDWVKDDTMYMVSSIYAGAAVCGHYAVKTRLGEEKIPRFGRTGRAINIVMTEALSRYKQRNTFHDDTSTFQIDPISGLPNLKGLLSWFDNFSADDRNHEKHVIVSLYWIPKYKELHEQCGIRERDKMVTYVGELLRLSNTQNSFVSQIAEDEFVVVNYLNDENEMPNTIDHATNTFFGLREEFDREKRKVYGSDFELEVNCGCTYLYGGWKRDTEISSLIKMARTEMFANRLKYNNESKAKSQRSVREDYNSLMLLISQNKFIYHYQPIIDVKARNIYAYEALMRTDREINMSPLEILATADSYNRLYSIERATVFNVLKQYADSHDKLFFNRKVFINSIPGHFLNSNDRQEILTKYSSYLDSTVFEIIESDAAGDEEIDLIRTMGSGDIHIPIAIDDYGSGYSNMVNLLRYAPQIIKVDRLLIADIDKDANKQMFMTGTIDFAKANQIKVLAEGVETQEEFRTVVALGVDYVQGYYTGKPAQQPMADIPDYVVLDIDAVLCT